MQYRLGDAIIVGGKIVGYDVMGPDGRVKHLRLSDVISIAKTKQINAEVAVDDDGNEHISIIGDKYEAQEEAYIVQSRATNNGKLISYRCKLVSTGEYKKITPAKLWEFASKGQVIGVEARVFDKSLVLVGKDFRFGDLPEIKV